MLFNINQNVRVKLNDYGRKIHKEYFDHLAEGLNTSLKYAPPKEDAEGWSSWQLWHLMRVFGPYLWVGGKVPFDNWIFLPAEHLHLPDDIEKC